MTSKRILIICSIAAALLLVVPVSATDYQYTVSYGASMEASYTCNYGTCVYWGSSIDRYYSLESPYYSTSTSYTCGVSPFVVGTYYLADSNDDAFGSSDTIECISGSTPTTTTTTVTTTTTPTVITTTTSSSSITEIDLGSIWSAIVSLPETLANIFVQFAMAAAYPVIVAADIMQTVFGNFYTVLATFINALISIPNTIIIVWNIGLFTAFPTEWTMILTAMLFISLGLRLYSFLKDVEILGNKV